MSRRQRSMGFVISLVTAFVLATGMMIIQRPTAVKAACYFGAYTTDTRSNTSLRGVTITSSVKYKTGYTCSGAVTELNVYSFSVTIKIVANDEWWGYTRYLRSVRIVDGLDVVKRNYLNVRSCAAANCTMTYSATPNVTYAATGDRYHWSQLHIYCEDCSITSLGGWEFAHWFIDRSTGAFYCTC